MRVRTFFAILGALVVVVSVSYLSHHNAPLLTEPFQLTPTRTVPLLWVLLGVFLVGLLPGASVLIVQSLKADLARRRERRLSREATSLKGSFRRAVDFQVDGQWQKAAEELEAVLADTPEDFSALLRAGEVLRRLGRAEEALDVHRRASVLYPQSVAVLYELAADYESRGDAEVADQIMDRILRDFPARGLRILRRRRNEALVSENWKEAEKLQARVDQLLGEGPESDEWAKDRGVRLGLEYQRGVALLESEAVNEAEAGFRRVLAQEPTFLPATIMLGETLLELGDDEAAVVEWRDGFLASGSPIFLQRIEDHFIEREEPLRAIETLHGLIAQAESELLPRFFLGRLYYRLEMLDEALRTFEGLDESIQVSPTFHFLVARIRVRRGEMKQAVDAYLECIQRAGIAGAEYVCGVCADRLEAWRDRCERCGSWNSIRPDFEEEKISPEDLGLRGGAVLTVWEGVDDSGLLDIDSTP